jgi:hypothetical protein
MRANLRKWWWLAKLLLTAAIVVFIGRQFERDLRNPELWRISPRPGWLILSGLLYIVGLGFSAWYWIRLLGQLGQRPSVPTAVRAYYLGHLGKYVPGKAWALLMRTSLASGPGVRPTVAAYSCLYEVLMTMASGVLLAGLLIAPGAWALSGPLDWSIIDDLRKQKAPEAAEVDPRLLLVLAGFLFVLVGFPLLPPVFNLAVRRLVRPFQLADAAPLPRVPWRALLDGLLITGCGWLFLGASLWAMIDAVLEVPPSFTWELGGRCGALLALAYVAGFATVIPGGLLVREVLLALFLVSELAPYLTPAEREGAKIAVAIVGLLRIVWTIAELVTAAVVYWLPPPAALPPDVGGEKGAP